MPVTIDRSLFPEKAAEDVEEAEAEELQTEVTQENPVEENTPETGTEEAKEEAKDNKRALDNPVNPFRNMFFNKNTVFGKVISNLFSSKNKEDYHVTVMKSQDIPWEQLPDKTKKYFGDDTSEKRKEDKGKYLVITDKEIGRAHV